jgi:hypothetical protein
MVELYLQSPTSLHSVVLNYLNTGTTLPFDLVWKTVFKSRDRVVGIVTATEGSDFESR